MRGIVFCVGFLFLSGCVTTQSVDPEVSDKKFSEYRAEGGALDIMLENSAKKVRKTLTCDGQVYTFKRTGYKLIAPIVFPEKYKHPKSGGWYEFIDANICGDKIAPKYVFKAMEGKPPLKFPMLPGNSHADPVLQKDGAKYALTTVMQKHGFSKCKRLNIVDTQFVEKDTNGKWSEDWIVSVCGKKETVSMVFIPMSAGTSIKASLKR